MEHTVSATEARIHFGELMRQAVESRQPIIVKRGSEPHVVILSVAEYERLLQAQERQQDWKELVAQARAQIRAELGDRELPPPEEILRQAREERDAQLVALR
jgi:prevent-host-death family protein